MKKLTAIPIGFIVLFYGFYFFNSQNLMDLIHYLSNATFTSSDQIIFVIIMLLLELHYIVLIVLAIAPLLFPNKVTRMIAFLPLIISILGLIYSTSYVSIITNHGFSWGYIVSNLDNFIIFIIPSILILLSYQMIGKPSNMKPKYYLILGALFLLFNMLYRQDFRIVPFFTDTYWSFFILQYIELFVLAVPLILNIKSKEVL